MKRVLIVNPKGGCGKTTLATNLASYYAVWDVPTCIVDYDPQHSSLDWLAQRPDTYAKIQGVAGALGKPVNPVGAQRVVMDAPARTSDAQFQRLSDNADVILIPVLPSPIDIRAAAHFLGELLVGKKTGGTQIGLVANRVKENTLIFDHLEKFLKKIKIPLISHLRDTQNYIRAAEQGIGVFEMAPSQVNKDIEQWRKIINWVERGKKK